MTQPPVETPGPDPGRDTRPVPEDPDTGIFSGGEFGAPEPTPPEERSEGAHGDPVIDHGALAAEAADGDDEGPDATPV